MNLWIVCNPPVPCFFGYRVENSQNSNFEACKTLAQAPSKHMWYEQHPEPFFFHHKGAPKTPFWWKWVKQKIGSQGFFWLIAMIILSHRKLFASISEFFPWLVLRRANIFVKDSAFVGCEVLTVFQRGSHAKPVFLIGKLGFYLILPSIQFISRQKQFLLMI